MRSLVIALLFFSHSVFAQADKPVDDQENQSRWQAEVSFGLDLRSYKDAPLGEDDGSRLVRFALFYRLTRSFDLGLQYGFLRESKSGYRIFDLASSGRTLSSVWNRRSGNAMISLKPRFNLRVGQGDFAVSGDLGFVRHTTSTRVNVPGVLQSKVSAEPLLDYFYQASLSYTYWPTRRFGIITSADVITMQHGKMSKNQIEVDNTARYIYGGYSALEVNTESSREDFAPFLGDITPSTNCYLSIGLLVRL